MRLHQVLGQVHETMAGKRSIEHAEDTSEDELTFDANLQLTAPLAEFPR